MGYFVYLLVSSSNKNKPISYVGYTNNLKKRLSDHNNSKGAKSTKGHKWELIYKKKFLSQSKAMSYEYKLKHDRNKRLKIYNNFK